MLSITVVTMVLLLILLFFAPRIVITINSGQAGVLFKRFGHGTVTDRYYTEGINLVFPWDVMHIYDVRIQEKTLKMDVLTQDGLMVEAVVSVRYSANVNTLGVLHKFIGPDYAEKVVLPEVEAETRNVISQYDLEQLYTEDRRVIQQIITTLILDEINEQVIVDPLLGASSKDKTYIIFQDLFLENIKLPELVSQTIEQKVEAEHKFLTYKYLLQSEEREAIRKKIEARGIDSFEAISGISILKWRGLQATEKLSESENAKIILMGTDENLPIILNGEVPDTTRSR